MQVKRDQLQEVWLTASIDGLTASIDELTASIEGLTANIEGLTASGGITCRWSD